MYHVKIQNTHKCCSLNITSGIVIESIVYFRIYEEINELTCIVIINIKMCNMECLVSIDT